jgi:hypothetical protein
VSRFIHDAPRQIRTQFNEANPMPSPGVSSAFDPRPLVTPLKQPAIKFSPFDQHHYQRLLRTREEAIRNVLQRLSPAVGLKTALDAGAGVGFFSQTLADCGLSVRGFDGRAENVAEASKRFPHITFEQGDLEDHSIVALGNLIWFYVLDCFITWKIPCWRYGIFVR